MWKFNYKILPSIISRSTLLLPENITQHQVRTTFILKRRTPPLLHKKGAHPKRLRNKHYIYELVEDTDTKKLPDLEVILTNYVDGIGVKGQKVSVRPNFAYNDLLLPGLAVYPSPENIEKYKDFKITKDDVQHSSPTAQRAVNILSKMSLSVIMNKDIPWTIKPWHIKTAFRKCGHHVPEEAITIPPQPIKGPNLDLENKHFFITVTINKMEQVQVRCRIHHWSTSVLDRLPYEAEFWKNPTEPLFPEDKKQESDTK